MKLDSMEFSGGDVKKVSNAAIDSVNTGIVFTNADILGDSLSIGFEYTAQYSPDQSYIKISGRAVFSGKESKSAYDEWTKTRKVGGEVGEYILNAVHHNASMNSIVLAKVFNMAPPVVLPRLSFESKAPAKKK
jgi:hypothetical protein